MIVLKYLFDCLIVGFLVVAAFNLVKRRRLPVKFSTRDELEAFTRVVAWAHRQIGRDDPRWKAISMLYGYFVHSAPIGMTFVALARISAEDLDMLAPFIDQSIIGKGPPPILSAEYQNWIPTALNGFKRRMKAEGLWRHEPVRACPQSVDKC